MWRHRSELQGQLSQKYKNTNKFSIIYPNLFKLDTYARFSNCNLFADFCVVTIPISQIIPILVNPANFRYSE